MVNKEKTLILFALSFLAKEYNIEDTELCNTEKLTDMFNKVLEENQKLFSDKDELKQEIIKLFQKYTKKLSDNKKKGG